jgi:hypothetical protein
LALLYVSGRMIELVGIVHACLSVPAGFHKLVVLLVIAACWCLGPLVMHIAKLFPKNDCSSFDAYGRILSGTLRPGDEVRGGPRCPAYYGVQHTHARMHARMHSVMVN